VQLAGLQGRERPRVDRVWITVFAADHGVVRDELAATARIGTGDMLRIVAVGGAAISVLARALNATLDVVSLGTLDDPGALAGVSRDIVASSTASIIDGPAMTEVQLDAALVTGARSVERALAADAQVFIGGDMGLHNHIVARALACALLGETADVLADRENGDGDASVTHEAAIIERALLAHAAATTPWERLRCLGGFDIAAMAGACIAAAQHGMPFLVDGFVASVAALAAVTLRPGVRPWLMFANRSPDPAHARLLAAMDGEPLLDLELAHGEGSGAALAVPLLRLACSLHGSMATCGDGEANPSR
jgi:nicotinate-nucleotide--dimethylbenzimidazole phosphoribosyltransferase